MRTTARLIFLCIFSLSLSSLAQSTASVTLKYVLQDTGLPTHEILAGEKVAIHLENLHPDSVVTLECQQHHWVSRGQFRADSKGVIDLGTQAPLEGTYSGIDLDGMFWSQLKESEHRPRLHLDAVSCAAIQDNQTVAVEVLQRKFAKPGISAKILKRSQVGFWGAYAAPEGKGPYPALIVVGGSEGGMNAGMAEYFASLGYATLSLAYFNYEDLPKDLDRIPLEYFKKAIRWLQYRPEINRSKLAVVGTSRGGELALLLGATFPDLKAIVAVSPSTLIWSGNFNPATGKENSSWTWQGHDIPFMPYGDPKIPEVTLPDGRVVSDLTAAMREVLKNWKKYPESEIAIEKTRGPILMLGGDSDMLWPSCDFMNMATERIRLKGHPYKDSFICFPEAGHWIGIPGEPTTDLVFEDTSYHMINSFGGTAQGTAHAQRQGWDQVLRFLSENLN